LKGGEPVRAPGAPSKYGCGDVKKRIIKGRDVKGLRCKKKKEEMFNVLPIVL